MKARGFRALNVWQLGKAIAVETYKLTRGFPPSEKYGLAMQMRRAGVSIPSNIAAGFNRQHPREYKQFLFVALGSCAELETQVEISISLELCSIELGHHMLALLDHEARMLRKLATMISHPVGYGSTNASGEKRMTSDAYSAPACAARLEIAVVRLPFSSQSWSPFVT